MQSLSKITWKRKSRHIETNVDTKGTESQALLLCDKNYYIYLVRHYISFFSVFLMHFCSFAGTDARIPSAAVGHSFAASARKHVLISNCSCSRNANIDIPWQRMAWPTKADLYCYTHTAVSRGGTAKTQQCRRFQNTSGLRRSSQRVISQMFTNRRYFKNVKFAINDTKTCVISKSDLSAAATESRHTLVVWPFC